MNKGFWCVLFLLAGFTSSAQAAPLEPFAIYYSDQAPLTSFEPFKLLVLDKDTHPPIAPLKQKGRVILGYLSVGEAEERHSYCETLRKAGLLVGENANWKKSYMIDMRNPLWERMVIDKLIPSLLAEGFDGVFLDTLDDPADLERRHPGKFKGLTQAAAHLVKAIHAKYPGMPLMMNRGYELLPQVANSITMELGESVYTDYNFTTKTYGHVKPEDYAEQVEILKNAKKSSPKLSVYTLDYWNPDDREQIAKIYKQERANGFIPYVSTVALDTVFHEPAAH